ncbi:MAG: tol-pal system YbgF family protein [Verrucomicrobium sp.]
MSPLKSLFLVPLACLGFSTPALHAQALVLKDGSRLAANSFSVADGKVSRTVKLSNGQEAKASLQLTDIARMDWPEVREVLEAQALLSEGKSKEAIEVLTKAKDFFKPFKGIPGSPYNDVSLAHVEALDQAGDFDALIRVLPEVEGMKWDEQKKLKIRILKLNMDRRTSSDQDAILSQAEDLIKDTLDAGISARLWMVIAEIHTRKERWEDALMAYLHVPVFYGSQAALVPQAELAAARSLTKMERFKDAVGFYQRIMEAYPGSETAENAKKEMAIYNGRENKPDKPQNASKDPSTKTESK